MPRDSKIVATDALSELRELLTPKTMPRKAEMHATDALPGLPALSPNAVQESKFSPTFAEETERLPYAQNCHCFANTTYADRQAFVTAWAQIRSAMERVRAIHTL